MSMILTIMTVMQTPITDDDYSRTREVDDEF